MDGRRPEQISEVLVALLERGDTESLAGLYEAEAVFADFDATVRGRDDIVGAHQRFCDADLTLILNESVVFEVDDIALVHWSWTVRDADGSTRKSISAEVLRRQPDGTWKFMIDNSDGTALVGSPKGSSSIGVDCSSTA